jgi:hypothetical protein
LEINANVTPIVYFDLQAAVARPDLQCLAGLQAEGLAQRFGDDDTAGGIESGFHGI